MKSLTMLRSRCFPQVAALLGAMTTLISWSALAQPLTTQFQCLEKRPTGFATVARRGELVTPPLLTWDKTLGGGWTPEKRCETVSQRFNQAVQINGGKLSYLRLTYGPLNGETVICYTDNSNRPCSSSSLLFTLSTENADTPQQVLTDLKTFALSASGTAIQESPPQLLYETEDGRTYFDLGEWSDRVEWQPISDLAAVDPSAGEPTPKLIPTPGSVPETGI